MLTPAAAAGTRAAVPDLQPSLYVYGHNPANCGLSHCSDASIPCSNSTCSEADVMPHIKETVTNGRCMCKQLKLPWLTTIQAWFDVYVYLAAPTSRWAGRRGRKGRRKGPCKAAPVKHMTRPQEDSTAKTCQPGAKDCTRPTPNIGSFSGLLQPFTVVKVTTAEQHNVLRLTAGFCICNLYFLLASSTIAPPPSLQPDIIILMMRADVWQGWYIESGTT